MLAQYMSQPGVCPFLSSITRQCSNKMAKDIITKITPHQYPGTLVF